MDAQWSAAMIRGPDKFSCPFFSCCVQVITSIPSWVNEKKAGVSILGTMGFAMPMALVLFSVIGVFGGMAYAPWFDSADSDDTLLNKLQDSHNVLAHITFYLFPVVVNLTSIPVFGQFGAPDAHVCWQRMRSMCVRR